MDMQVLCMTEEEREEIISYGTKRCKVIFVSTLVVLTLSWILGIIWQGIIFWLCLSVLRRYAGGYHADTEKRCYVISFVMILISLLCIKFIHFDKYWELFIIQTINFFIIFLMAPIENKNHILDFDEKSRYGDLTKSIELSLYFVYIFLNLVDRYKEASSIGMANILVAVSILLGYAKNYRILE